MTDLSSLTQMFNQNKISRRQFLTGMSALGLAAAVSPAMLPGTAWASEPKRGGRFIMGCTGGSTTDSMDPGTLTSNMNYSINWQIRNSLVEIDHNFKPIPELAESWDSSPDAKVWRFKLRKGVEFHNGKTMTAEDVIFTINHHRGEKSKSVVKPYLKSVENIKADGKYEVIFELSGGSADFPFILGDHHLTICPAGTKGREWEKGIGTGGYILEKWEPGVKAFATRNPNYWKEGRAFFDEIETLSIVDTNARTNALKTGQIHYMDRVELKTASLMKRMPGINVTATTGTAHYSIPMIVDQTPYSDNNVRMALKLAVNREELLKQVLRGYGELGNDHPIAPVNQYFAKNLEQRKYDPDKAKFYMKKAGMLDHVFNLHAADAAFAGAVDAAILIKEQAKKAGLTINVVREPDDGYWSNVWTKKEWCMCYWTGRPTEDMMFSLAYASGAPWNDTHWKNKRFNNLLIDARAELDTGKRRQMYLEMQEICRNDGGTIVPMYNQMVEASSDKLAHGPIAGNMPMDGFRNTERWWFKS
ncbi:ABC transporter substrate-binding protein [Desulfobacula toluolica]|uniref:Peptide ABC transporter, periplasmic peptide-binding protein n=1 Tax=Desulfobacula toluolica (strain DSM 7467 / Tol2) TaxID=651182 RepID=K0NFM2_DESTT|nr:ABC transporter substrate-binding protein [Desulfobacula toluolica]CCK79730.1 peptide ABC transporter, periplasmic peptide-binding protein [Desulfobacula toluolica Tol2]